MSGTTYPPAGCRPILKNGKSVKDFIGMGAAPHAPGGLDTLAYIRASPVFNGIMVLNLGPSPALFSPLPNLTPDANGNIEQGETIQPGDACLWLNVPPAIVPTTHDDPQAFDNAVWVGGADYVQHWAKQEFFQYSAFGIGGTVELDVVCGFIGDPTKDDGIRTQTILPGPGYFSEAALVNLGHNDLTPLGTLTVSGNYPTIR